jgi:hypothetical protein
MDSEENSSEYSIVAPARSTRDLATIIAYFTISLESLEYT